MSTDTMIERLRELLRGEVSAVDTYELALRWTKDPALRRVLWQLQGEHDERVRLLRTKLHELAAEPAEGSGVWGAFAGLVQAGADLLGDATAVAALLEGEEHGLRNYQKCAAEAEPLVQDLVNTVLLPAQQKSVELCRTLKQHVLAA
jgi:demethoxyubiquinone hydroxylase (CLK1/Coq7/Cat5 family)